MRVPFEPDCTLMPVPLLPEMTLPSPAAEPPIVLIPALLLIEIPTPLKMAAVPAAFSPM